MNKKFCLIGSCYPEKQLQEILSDSKAELSYAAENLQKAIIAGLDINCDDLTVISAPSVGTWPRGYKKIFFRGETFAKENRDVDETVSYINIPLFVHLFKQYSMQKALYKWAKSYPPETEKKVIIYEMTSSRLLAAVWLKKHVPNVKICLIVPDLPQYMSENKNKFFLLLKKIDFKRMCKSLKHVDCFVLLSEKMKEKIPVADKPYCVMEGIFSAPETPVEAEKEEKYTIFYTGNLSKRSGLLMLLEAFSLLDNNYQLWIRGNGVLKESIIEAGKRDPRIQYLPPLSRQKILEYQKRATILVNTVSPAEEFSNYFFPSKIMEYIASGTPVVMFELGCLPQEYLSHIVIPQRVDASALAESFKEIAAWSSEKYTACGQENIRFILEEKNPEIQTAKIVDLMQ